MKSKSIFTILLLLLAALSCCSCSKSIEQKTEINLVGWNCKALVTNTRTNESTSKESELVVARGDVLKIVFDALSCYDGGLYNYVDITCLEIKETMEYAGTPVKYEFTVPQDIPTGKYPLTIRFRKATKRNNNTYAEVGIPNQLTVTIVVG